MLKLHIAWFAICFNKLNNGGDMTNQLFIPFHFAGAAANRLTNAALDPVCKIPELKVCAVNIFPER